jgi:cytidine deaminase
MKDYELNDNDIKDIGIVKNMMAQVLEKSYSPYSKFKVGAILHTKDKKTYTGVNIENMGIQSICAERCAFAKAISSGVKKNEYSHIIICGMNEKGDIEDITPCRIL